MLETGLETLITYNPWTLSSATSVAEAARLLDDTGIGHWPIVDDEGMLTGELSTEAVAAALESHADGDVPVRMVMDPFPEPIDLAACPLTALRQMLAQQRRMLTVIDHGRVIGTLAASDYLRELAGIGRHAATELVLDHLERSTESIDADASIDAAMAALVSGRSRHLVVVQGDFPLGAVSRAGLTHARVQEHAQRLQGAPRPPRTLGHLLQSAPTIPPGRTLGEAASLMAEHNLDALAVITQGASLLGIITDEHILTALLDLQR